MSYYQKIMNKEILVLFMDETSQSKEVLELLEKSGLTYRTIPASGDNLPAVKFGHIIYGRTGGWVYKVIHDLEAISKEEKLSLASHIECGNTSY